MKPFDIFSAGKHVAKDGRVLTFTEAQIREGVAAYNPALHEAPIVIGHPEASGAPAYGWIKKLAIDDKAGGVVVAEPHQLASAFEEGVQAGHWKKRSAAWFLPDTPGNPTPGKLYLHHVAFLGANAPAIKGLREVQFNAEHKVAEFAEWHQMAVVRLFRNVKNFWIEKFGQDSADKVIPEYELESAAAEPVKPASYQEQPQETADVLTQQEIERREKALKDSQDALNARVTQFEEREHAFNTTQTAAALAAALATSGTFVDGLVREGKVLPAQRDGLVAFMAALPASGIVEFGEGDKKVKKPSAEWLQSYLTAQPKVVDFQERGGGELPKDMTADVIANKAIEFQEAERKAGREVSITKAVTHVTQHAAK